MCLCVCVCVYVCMCVCVYAGMFTKISWHNIKHLELCWVVFQMIGDIERSPIVNLLRPEVSPVLVLIVPEFILSGVTDVELEICHFELWNHRNMS